MSSVNSQGYKKGEVTDINIKVPWGYLAVKVWGAKELPPVVALHGLQQNAGCFDQLVPLLPRTLRYVCVDLPGHGRSCPFPAGLPLNFFNYVYSVVLVVRHFGWDKCALMAHSFGAQVATFYAAMFPEKVSRYVAFDSFIPFYVDPDRTVKFARKQMDMTLQYTVPSERKMYSTREQALSRVMNGRFGKLTERAASALLERSLFKTDKGYCFNYDPRLQQTQRPLLSIDQIMSFTDAVSCPVLLIMANDTMRGEGVSMDPSVREVFKQGLEQIRKDNPLMKVSFVDGNHMFHVNKPETVAEQVTGFLLDTKCSL